MILYQKRVEICGISTGNIKTIKEKEKMNLIKKAQNGDIEARDELIKGNLRLVLSVVQKFSNRSDALDDIFQVGTIGLIKAVDNFDISQNTRFSTYAVPMIIGEIRRYIRDNASIRVSRSMREIAYKAMNIKEEIFKSTGKEPTIDEISQKLEIPKETISISLESISDPLSLDEPIFANDHDSTSLIDQLESESDKSWTDFIVVKDRIKSLSKREKLIISMRCLQGLTQTEVSKQLNISQAQVSRLEKNAIKKIKK